MFQVISNENNSNDIEKINYANQTMNKLNESSQVQTSNNEAELNLTKPIPSSSANSNNNKTATKKKEFKRDCSLKNRKLERGSTSSETNSVLDVIKQLDDIAERATQHSKKEDTFDQFGKYVASILRNLPHEKACLLQQQMTTILMNEIIENQNKNKINEQQRFFSPQTSTNTSNSEYFAMFGELLSESLFTEAKDCYMITDL